MCLVKFFILFLFPLCDAFSDYLFNIHIIIVNLIQVKLLIKKFVNYYYNINGTTSLKTVFIYKKKNRSYWKKY